MRSLEQYAFSFGAALGLSLLFTLIVRTTVIRIGVRRAGAIARPRADRWHRRPTALYGGVAIFGAFVLVYVLRRPPGMHGDALLVLCAGGMFAVGLVDDLFTLQPYAKLVGQIVISTAFTMWGMRLHWLPSAVLDQGLTIFWLVGITNAVNLLDNLDGLAGGVAAIAAGYLVYFCHASGQHAAADLCAAFAGAAVGFLFFNFNPASIFMGDCGSLFLGFFLGGVTMVNNQGGLRRNIVAVLAVPVLLLCIPIVDTTLVTLSRSINGRRVSQGGRDHTSHRLVALGLSEREAALTLWALAAASGAIAVGVHLLSLSIGVVLVPVFGMGLLFFLVFVGRVRVYEPVAHESEVAGRALLPTLADFTYKRRVFEVLNDLALVVLASYGAFLLRFDGALVEPHYHFFIRSLPLVIVLQLSAFLAFGMYRGLWRYTSVSDLGQLVKAVAGGWTLSTLATVFVFRYDGYSRGALVMDGVLLLFGICGSRLSFRIIRAWVDRFQTAGGGRRALIYGAGDGGELLLRELRNNRELGLNPVGFVDDDPHKHGRVIHGVRVLGSASALTELLGREHIEELVISTTKIAADRSAAITTACQAAGVNCRRLRIALE